MNISLVLAPSWIPENPPVNISIISSFLKNIGHHVRCFDFNIRFYNYIKQLHSEDKSKNNQNSSHKVSSIHWQNNLNFVWEDPAFVKEVIDEHNLIIDKYVTEIIATKPQIVGFSVYTISLYFSIEIAERIKKINPEIIIVFGGPACFPNSFGSTLFYFTNSVDYICFGEGEIALSILADELHKNITKENIPGFYYRSKDNSIKKGDVLPFVNMKEIPHADFSDYILSEYTTRTIPINTSRGCINRCSFCNESPFWKKFRIRNADDVFKEIEEIINVYPETKHIWFTDSLINGNLEFLEELCDKIILNNIKISWTASAYVRKDMNESIFRKIKMSGCDALLFGLENGCDKILQKMNKGYDSRTARHILLLSKKTGITTYTNLIVGHPGETHLNFLKTLFYLIFFLNPKNIRNTTINTCYVLNYSSLKKFPHKYDIKYGLVDYWYSNDGKNNKKVRDLRKKILKAFEFYNHYDPHLSPVFDNSAGRWLKTYFSIKTYFLLFYALTVMPIKCFFISYIFNKEKKKFYALNLISTKNSISTNYLSIQEKKINFIVEKVKKHIKKTKLKNETKVIEKIQYNLDQIVSLLEKDCAEQFLDSLFPVDADVIIKYFYHLEENEFEKISLLIKTQLSSDYLL